MTSISLALDGVPTWVDYVVVAYLRGPTEVHRRTAGDPQTATLGAGDVSLLTRDATARWTWSRDVEVVHAYLTRDGLAATGRRMYRREVHDVALPEVIRSDDPAVHHTTVQIAREAAAPGAGSALLVESLSCQLAVHVLRRHAHVVFRHRAGGGGLDRRQERTVCDYVDEHLREHISLDDLAGSVALSRYHFARRFRQAVGVSPHEYVVRLRVQRAATLLRQTGTPLRDVALRCGFADQSHLTRVFKKHTGVTPGRYRTPT